MFKQKLFGDNIFGSGAMRLIQMFRSTNKTAFILGMSLFVLFATIGIGHASDKIFTIGIINPASQQTETVKGFKEGMAELGYVEGKDIRYICSDDIKDDEQAINEAINKLLSNNIDLLLAVANETAIQAKKITEGTDIPVLAAACIKMVESGLVKDLKYPDGNITGIRIADNFSKALEWLVNIIPNAKNIYLPYNPEDNISIIDLPELNKTASQLGINLVSGEIHSAEEAVAAIENLPKDIDAIFRVPSPTIGMKTNEVSRAAIRRRLPLGSPMPLDEAALASFGSHPYEIGIQAARLAHQIYHGIKPADLPVETAEVFLTINLKTAEEIGLKIPDNILLQAKKIIR